jgi:hypothetical protein
MKCSAQAPCSEVTILLEQFGSVLILKHFLIKLGPIHLQSESYQLLPSESGPRCQPIEHLFLFLFTWVKWKVA